MSTLETAIQGLREALGEEMDPKDLVRDLRTQRFLEAALAVVDWLPEDTDDDDDIIDVLNWQDACRCGDLGDYDGYGYALREISDGYQKAYLAVGKNKGFPVLLKPSGRKNVPEGTTHILWINRRGAGSP